MCQETITYSDSQIHRRGEDVNPGAQIEWASLKDFTDWWWSENPYSSFVSRPLAPPPDAVKMCEASCEFVIFRRGQYQVEQIILMPGRYVPPHNHPNVDTFEIHLMGSGTAELKLRNDSWFRCKQDADLSKLADKRRLHIKPGQMHRGVAATVNVALSFQRWLNGVRPTFITDDWVGEPW